MVIMRSKNTFFIILIAIYFLTSCEVFEILINEEVPLVNELVSQSSGSELDQIIRNNTLYEILTRSRPGGGRTVTGTAVYRFSRDKVSITYRSGSTCVNPSGEITLTYDYFITGDILTINNNDRRFVATGRNQDGVRNWQFSGLILYESCTLTWR